MNRDEMIEILIPAYVDMGKSLADARRQLFRMSAKAMQRELLLRGLQDYDEPSPVEDDEPDDDPGSPTLALGWSDTPLYAD